MNFNELLASWQLNPGASEAAIQDAVTSLGHSLPSDYLEFLREHNGGEGFVGDDYLVLWQAEELDTFNREYQIDEYAPGLIAFGSSGGGDAYAFDMRTAAAPIVRVPFIGIELRYAKPMADTFTNLLRQMANHGKQ